MMNPKNFLYIIAGLGLVAGGLYLYRKYKQESEIVTTVDEEPEKPSPHPKNIRDIMEDLKKKAERISKTYSEFNKIYMKIILLKNPTTQVQILQLKQYAVKLNQLYWKAVREKNIELANKIMNALKEVQEILNKVENPNV